LRDAWSIYQIVLDVPGDARITGPHLEDGTHDAVPVLSEGRASMGYSKVFMIPVMKEIQTSFLEASWRCG
jgi:hypothetical protein